MAAGAWVFPIAIVGFFAFLVGFVASNPAVPLPGNPEDRFRRVEPNDTVWLEYTEFYDPSNKYVSYTTEEDRYFGEDLKRSPYGVGFSAPPQQIRVPPAATDPVLSSLLGRKVNETFETDKFAKLRGDWQETRTINRTIGGLNTTVRLANGSATPQGPFNFSSFVQEWSRAVGHPLAAGDRIECEGVFPWLCEIVSVDVAGQAVVYRRDAKEGERVPAASILPFARGTPTPASNVTVHRAGADRIELVFDAQPGDAFVFGNQAGGWAAGAYRVEGGTAQEATVRYSPTTRDPAHLIGETIWYEITVVQISREPVET